MFERKSILKSAKRIRLKYANLAIFIELEKVLSNKGLAQKYKHSSDSRRILFQKFERGFEILEISCNDIFCSHPYELIHTVCII